MRIKNVGDAFWLALLAAAAACGSQVTDTGPAANADLKVIHAAAGLGAIDVRVGNASVINGLPYGRSSALTRVPSGLQRVAIQSGAVQIAEQEVSLRSDRVNALTLSEDTVQVSPVTPDTGWAATDRANVRIINIAGTSTAEPTLLSVLINFPGVGADSVARLGLDSRVASHGPLMYFDPGHFRFRVAPAGTTTVLAEVEFDVAAGEKKAVVLERNAAGAYTARVVTEP
jgi:hypothetical protein